MILGDSNNKVCRKITGVTIQRTLYFFSIFFNRGNLAKRMLLLHLTHGLALLLAVYVSKIFAK
jgi:hypothetical protein